MTGDQAELLAAVECEILVIENEGEHCSDCLQAIRKHSRAGAPDFFAALTKDGHCAEDARRLAAGVAVRIACEVAARLAHGSGPPAPAEWDGIMQAAFHQTQRELWGRSQ
jgi:hypothetical protein